MAKSTISGYVFLDSDGNGRRGPGEQGIAAVTVKLTGTDAGGQAVDLITTTDATGAWAFTKLIAGTYQVTEVQPATVIDGADSLGVIRSGADGASAGTLGNDSVTGIILSGLGSQAVGYGFGEGPAGVSPTPACAPNSLAHTGSRWVLLAGTGTVLVLAGILLVVMTRWRTRRGQAGV